VQGRGAGHQRTGERGTERSEQVTERTGQVTERSEQTTEAKTTRTIERTEQDSPGFHLYRPSGGTLLPPDEQDDR
jgi:hypothetical protein